MLKDPDTATVAILKRQFDPAMLMLEKVIRRCPEKIWLANPHGHPIWKRVLHALESVDYHFNSFGRYLFSGLGGTVSPEFDRTDAGSLSREAMLRYFEDVKAKCATAFEALDDTRLLTKTSSERDATYLDTIILQIRHLALNAGRCTEALAASGCTQLEWEGYCE